ncbi:hypothetical protein [Sporomusa paucivorans]|uniref:hypothetical protein n=3 Tax=Sporomusa TaxID=2375 RepID=UPI00315B606B
MMTNKTFVKSLILFLVATGALPVEAAMMPTSAPALFSSPTEAKKAEEYVYAFAVKLIAEKKFAQAAAILKELLDSGSEVPSPDEFVRLLNQLDDHTGIIQYYEKNRTRAFAGETYGYIGIAYMEQRDVANAAVCFNKAAASSPASRQAAYSAPARNNPVSANPLLEEGYRSSAYVQSAPAPVFGSTATGVVNPYDLPQATYNSLIDDLMQVGQSQPPVDKKLNLSTELRYHYAANSGSERLDKDNSGLRLYLGADTALNQDWRFYARGEAKQNIKNYDNMFDLTRYYVEGKTGATRLTAGKFSYLMADGNIYDSGFTGVRADFGKAVKYTAALGYTNDEKTRSIIGTGSVAGIPVFADYVKDNDLTAIGTAHYSDYDYDLEAGIYAQRLNEEIGVGIPGLIRIKLLDLDKTQTIKTISGKYHFSNFSLGGRLLRTNMADAKGNKTGYVLSLDYGELKSWRPHTYSLFANYYDQPRYTYFSHGMNGLGNRMEGFKGWGLGANYTLQEDLIFGIEHYRLTDKVTNEKADTWWTYLTHYFSNK